MAKKQHDPGNGLKVTIDNLPELRRAMAALIKNEVLVGVPGDKTDRPPVVVTDPDTGKAAKVPITNAALAYIHDNGAPEVKIPARPFMVPGIMAVQGVITETLAKSAQYALQGDFAKIEVGFNRIGLLAVSSIQGVIRRGIPPPLADRTLEERLSRAPGRKGETMELERRDRGAPPGILFAIPLMDTNEMLKSINYVIRKKQRY